MRENKDRFYETQARILIEIENSLKKDSSVVDYEKALSSAIRELGKSFFKELRRQEDETIAKKLQERKNEKV